MIKEYGPFDIQHSYDFTTLPLEAVTSRLYGRKFIHHQRNLNVGGHLNFLKIRLFFSNFIIAASPSTKGFVDKIKPPGKPCAIIANGMELEDVVEKRENVESNKNSDDKKSNFSPNLIMVSSLIPLKRIEDGIKAVSKLKKKYPKIKLRIIGSDYDHAYRKKIENDILVKGLKDNVTYLGRLDNQHVLKSMQQSDIFVHCAENEAFGWVLLEAFSQMTPVISADSEGPSFIIQDGENGLLYPVGDAESLANKIDLLIQNPDLRNKISNQAYLDLEKRFSAKAMVNQIAAVYRSVSKRTS